MRIPKSEKEERSSDVIKRSIPSWRKADEREKSSFASELEVRLEEIELPAHMNTCRNVKCTDVTHRLQADKVMHQALNELEYTARKTIPLPGGKDAKVRIPDWKDDVAPYKENAHFWHSVWVSAGKPMNCHLHKIMKMTRNRYHLILRKKKRLLEKMKRDNMLSSCLNNDNNIFKEIKKTRRCAPNPSSTIDGISEDIPGYLANRYEKLYNGVDDKSNLAQLGAALEDMIDDRSEYYIQLITPNAVKAAARRLKPAKTDPIVAITSDFFINALDRLYLILAECLKSYITHAHVSQFLLTSMMIPLIKDKLGDTGSSDNYRSIAISSLIMKIYDLVILSVFGEYLELDDLQFGYQTEISTTMCTWLAVETISHYQRNGSEVFSCLMDMSKAFDMVQHSTLFKKLLNQGMPPIIVRYILATYRKQQANVNWNGTKSDYFNIGNGVKQGAILSAVLYCVYTNDLFRELRRMNIGCRIGGEYVGVLGYADDLFLISPTMDGLQDMLTACERYASEHNLRFSTNENPVKSKTKCMAFLCKERPLRRLRLCGNELPWVEKGKHLGITLTNNRGKILTSDIMEKRARYIQVNNELMQEFYFSAGCTKAFINRVFNSHFYGSVLWNLYGKEATMVYNTWSVSTRRMFELDRKTHRYLLEPISGMPHIRQALISRFVNFVSKLSSSKKELLRNAYEAVRTDCRSTTGANIRNIRLECNIGLSDQLSAECVRRWKFQPVPPGEEWRIDVVNHILSMRNNRIDDNIMVKDELDAMLDYVCTM